MIETVVHTDQQIHQGDVFRNVDCIEKADVVDGLLEISKINYPLVIILAQECDLRGDHAARNSEVEKGQLVKADKLLNSVLAVPLYNYSHFRNGEHLEKLGCRMSSHYSGKESSTAVTSLRNNEVPRYHFMEFQETVPVVDSIADFKHYFTVSLSSLYSVMSEQRVCSLQTLYRERISQRFAEYLSRIGLPDK